MSDDRGLTQPSKRDCCSLAIIFRSFRISIAFPILLLASLGAVLTPLGWWLSEVIFVGGATDYVAEQQVVVDELEEEMATSGKTAKAAKALGVRLTKAQAELENRLEIQSVSKRNKKLPGDPGAVKDQVSPDGDKPVESLAIALVTNADSFPGLTYHRFVEPFRELFVINKGFTRFSYFLFGGLWTVLVWGLFGGAITRIAIMQLGCDERISMREGLEHAMRKITSYIMSPLLPIIGVVLCAVPIAVLGLIMKADVGVIVGGVFWLLALLAGFVMALLLLGLLFGWPLMWATLSAEGTDSFDALSRSYAYTFQRPLKYLGYVVVAILLGALTWWLVYFFSETVIDLAYWGAHWGTGYNRITEIGAITEGGGEAEGALSAGAFIIKVCVHVIRTLATAFSYSFFWCAMCAVYLLLRRDVDQTEFDEIFVDDDEEKFGLPKVKQDEAGVAVVADKPAEEADAEPQAKAEAEGEPATADDAGASESSDAMPEASDDAGDANETGDDTGEPKKDNASD